MKHAPSVWKLLPVASMVIVLNGCSSNPAATRVGPEQAKAEEAVIRRTFADLEERINKGDPGFVDIFAKTRSSSRQRPRTWLALMRFEPCIPAS